MLLDSIPGVTEVAERDGALFILWTKYGKWGSEGPRLFTEHVVQRQDGHLRGTADVDVPNSCTVLQLSDKDRAEYGLRVSGILIRDDYLKLLRDILHFATKRVFPQNDAVDDSPITFDNPFLDNNVQRMPGAVMLLGHPGIGKSLWLIVVLILRVLAGCPTIYHSRPQICYIFNEEGVYKVKPTSDDFIDGRAYFNEAISSKYWCLVDCTCSIQDVPKFLSETSAFIVQAASPSSKRFDWVEKYSFMVPRYFMRNWSLTELIIGCALQHPMNQCSEQGLKVFYSRYAPSARMAYAYADNLDLYEEIVDTEITLLTIETLRKILSSTDALQVEHVLHHILLVNPQSNRSRLSITIPSRYLYDKLHDRLYTYSITLEEAARLGERFMWNQYTKAGAGYRDV